MWILVATVLHLTEDGRYDRAVVSQLAFQEFTSQSACQDTGKALAQAYENIEWECVAK